TWRGRVQGLQIPVGAVLSVAVAVGRQGLDLVGGVVMAHEANAARAGVAVFVNVVAEEQRQVRVLVGHVAIGAEPALLPMRAGSHRLSQGADGSAARGRRRSLPDGTAVALGGEAVPVRPRRIEA